MTDANGKATMHIIDPAFPGLSGKNEKRIALILNAYAGARRDVVEEAVAHWDSHFTGGTQLQRYLGEEYPKFNPTLWANIQWIGGKVKPRTQRAVARALVVELGLGPDDRERFVHAFAAEIRAGRVTMRSNKHDLTAEEYAWIMWADGHQLRNPWLKEAIEKNSADERRVRPSAKFIACAAPRVSTEERHEQRN